MSKRCKDGSRDMRYTSNREHAEREQEVVEELGEQVVESTNFDWAGDAAELVEAVAEVAVMALGGV